MTSRSHSERENEMFQAKLATLTVMAITLSAIVGIGFGATAATVMAFSTLPSFVIVVMAELKGGAE